MTSLSSMPLEIFMQISRLLRFHDLKRLSRVNSGFRALLALRLFRTLRFTNLESDSDAIRRTVSKHGSHIEQLQFDFHLRQDCDHPSSQPLPDGGFYEEDDVKSEDDVFFGTRLSSVASDILSGELLPGISSLTIKFLPEDDFNGMDWGDSQSLGSIYIYEHVVPPFRLEQVEKEWPSWRRAMAKMWAILSRNQSIRSLEVVHLPGLPVSSWLDPEWRAFLGRLTTLILGLGGGDDGVGSKANTMAGYRGFLENLNVHFLDLAKSVEKLHVIADSQSYYGDGDVYVSPTAFRPGQMPRLSEFRLGHTFIDENLCNFLEHVCGSSSRLKKLALMNCMANEETPSWAGLFSRLSALEDLSLQELEVSNETVEFTDDFESNLSHLPTLPKHVSGSILVRSSPKLDGEKYGRPFEYGTVDDSHGMVFSDEERNGEEFESGADMEAYRELMNKLAEKKKHAIEYA